MVEALLTIIDAARAYLCAWSCGGGVTSKTAPSA